MHRHVPKRSACRSQFLRSPQMIAMRSRFLSFSPLNALCLCAAACAASETGGPALDPLEIGAPPETAGVEGEAHGFPALRSLAGETLADGEFTQWLEGERLHQR